MSEKKKLHPLERAYLAGVFDARVTFPKSGYVLRFESADEQLIKRFHETLGFGRISSRHKKNCPLGVWTFQTINMDDTREMLLTLSPFLKGRRLAQSSEMIAKIERNPQWRSKNPQKVNSLVTDPAKSA